MIKLICMMRKAKDRQGRPFDIPHYLNPDKIIEIYDDIKYRDELGQVTTNVYVRMQGDSQDEAVIFPDFHGGAHAFVSSLKQGPFPNQMGD